MRDLISVSYASDGENVALSGDFGQPAGDQDELDNTG